MPPVAPFTYDLSRIQAWSPSPYCRALQAAWVRSGLGATEFVRLAQPIAERNGIATSFRSIVYSVLIYANRVPHIKVLDTFAEALGLNLIYVTPDELTMVKRLLPKRGSIPLTSLPPLKGQTALPANITSAEVDEIEIEPNLPCPPALGPVDLSRISQWSASFHCRALQKAWVRSTLAMIELYRRCSRITRNSEEGFPRASIYLAMITPRYKSLATEKIELFGRTLGFHALFLDHDPYMRVVEHLCKHKGFDLHSLGQVQLPNVPRSHGRKKVLQPAPVKSH